MVGDVGGHWGLACVFAVDGAVENRWLLWMKIFGLFFMWVDCVVDKKQAGYFKCGCKAACVCSGGFYDLLNVVYGEKKIRKSKERLVVMTCKKHDKTVRLQTLCFF
ncbi:MAG: hypothetical protein L3J35_01805 [Bacteroidales bacterium]|nr:hypothetical protein [Bacteroidales bacterium]